MLIIMYIIEAGISSIINNSMRLKGKIPVILLKIYAVYLRICLEYHSANPELNLAVIIRNNDIGVSNNKNNILYLKKIDFIFVKNFFII